MIAALEAYKKKQGYTDLKIIPIDQKILQFDPRVRLKCFYCEDYSVCLKCPGHFKDHIDPEAVIRAYPNLCFVYQEFSLENEKDPMAAMRKSGQQMHRMLLDLEKNLFSVSPLAVCFIAGRCRLCNECPVEKCLHPRESRISLEATGLNVIESAKSAGIPISFEDPLHYKRIGLLCW